MANDMDLEGFFGNLPHLCAFFLLSFSFTWNGKFRVFWQSVALLLVSFVAAAVLCGISARRERKQNNLKFVYSANLA